MVHSRKIHFSNSSGMPVCVNLYPRYAGYETTSMWKEVTCGNCLRRYDQWKYDQINRRGINGKEQ
jgi:hypothetical protein